MDLNRLFPFIVGTVFVGFVACFCFLIKRMFCSHPNHTKNEALKATLEVEPGQTIVFQPGDVLTVQQPMMASFTPLDGPHIRRAADSNDSSAKIFIINISEDNLPPSYQVATTS